MTFDAMQDTLHAASPSQRARLLREAHRRAEALNLRIDDQAIPFTLVPWMLPSGLWGKLDQELDQLMAAVWHLERHAQSPEGRALKERLMGSLTEGGRHMVDICNFERDSSMQRRLRRVDGYLDPRTHAFRVIEINQAAPLALHFHDTVQELCAFYWGELGVELKARPLAPGILQWMITEYQEHTGSQALPRRVAIPIEHGYPPKFTDLPGMAKRLERLAREIHGQEIHFTICFPYEISLKQGKAMLGGEEISMIWRNSVYMTRYREQGLPIGDYERILADPKNHLILNATKSWLTRTKELFAVLWNDPLVKDSKLDDARLQQIRGIVPETRNLGHEAQFQNLVSEQRTQWMSKPTDAGFGSGIEFGAGMEQSEWESLIQSRSRDGFVFQRRVAYPRLDTWQCREDGSLERQTLEVDFCPHIVSGQVYGSALCRGIPLDDSGKPRKMNLVGGGVMVPVFFQ